tara:strand:- start:454 stop:690 length:237 start_codon:yes stop_codon:yes gene_type:complete
MDFQFRLSIPADLAAAIHGILFDVEVTTRPAAASATDIPSACWIRDDMMGAPTILAFGHSCYLSLCCEPRQASQQDPS